MKTNCLRLFLFLPCLFFLFAVSLWAEEELRLPEQIVTEEASIIPLVTPFREEPETLFSPSPVLSFLPPSLPPAVSSNHLEIWGGSQESVGFSFEHQGSTQSFHLQLAQQKITPFPEKTTGFSLGWGIRRLTPMGIIGVVFSAGYLQDVPAVSKEGKSFLPGTLPDGSQFKASLLFDCLTWKAVHPFLHVTYRCLTNDDSENKELFWPDWVGRVGLDGSSGRFNARLFWDYEAEVDYGGPRKSPDTWLVGLSAAYQFRSNDWIGVEVRNITGRRYHLLPDREGPDTTGFLTYQHFF